MNDLYPIIRRVRRPLTMKQQAATPAVPAVALKIESASTVPSRSSTSHILEADAQPKTAPLIGDSLRVSDRRVGNDERKERHGGKASTTKKA